MMHIKLVSHSYVNKNAQNTICFEKKTNDKFIRCCAAAFKIDSISDSSIIDQ